MPIISGGDQPIFEDDWVACMSAHYQQALIAGDLENATGLRALLDQLGMAASTLDELENAAGVSYARLSGAATAESEIAIPADLPIPQPIAQAIELPASAHTDHNPIEAIRAETHAGIVTQELVEATPQEMAIEMAGDIGAMAAEPAPLLVPAEPVADPLIPSKPNKAGKKSAKAIPPRLESDKNQMSLF